MISTLIMQPGEALRPPVAFDTTRPIAQVLDVTVAARGLVPGAPPLAADAAIAAGGVALSLSGGGDGERYAVTVRVRDEDGAELESEVEVVLVETAWAMPDGGAPYLSIADFVRKFTLIEVVRMADSDGSGRIDRDLLVDALVDAQAEAEGYLGRRYALPLDPVPRIVATAIADRARGRLYVGKSPDGVEAASRNALRLLESIGKGDVDLGLPSSQPAAVAPSAAPILVAPGRRQYPDGLDEY